MQRTTGAILFLLLICIASFGQSSFKGLKPGQSTRTDVERVLGQSDGGTLTVKVKLPPNAGGVLAVRVGATFGPGFKYRYRVVR